MADEGRREKDLDLVEEFNTVRAITKDGRSVQVPKSKFGGNLEVASDNVLGGIKASPKSETDTNEVKIDPKTGKLYCPPSEVAMATAEKIGGIVANVKTSDETEEVKIDPSTGKAYVKPSSKLGMATSETLGGVKANPATDNDTQEVHITEGGFLVTRPTTGGENEGVTGVKGNAETSYRKGNVNITPANIGLGNVNNTADSNKSVKYATSSGSATKATQDANGNVITSTYATKTEVSNAESIANEANEKADSSELLANNALNSAREAKNVADEANVIANTAKNAVATLEGLSNTDTAQETLSAQVVQIETNKTVNEEQNVRLDNLEKVFKSEDISGTITSNADTYIRYSDGTKMSAATSSNIESYIIERDKLIGVTSLSIYCGFADNYPASIAFFSSDVIDVSGYIKESSVQAAPTAGRWFSANVPVNARIAVLSNSKNYVAVPTIKATYIDTLKNLAEMGENIETTPSGYKKLSSCWVKYEDGTLVSSGSHQTTIKFNVVGLSKVKVFIKTYDSYPAAIAFYDLDGNYLKNYSIKSYYNISTGGSWFEADVPTEASYAYTCSAESFEPIVRTNEIGKVVEDFIKDVSNQLNSKEGENSAVKSFTLGSAVYPVTPSMDYHHLFIDKIYANSVVTIPCQSIFDVHVAAKLGFKMIEVNVLQTSDGVPVCGHQVGTGILQNLTDLDGVQTNVTIPEMTFEDLRANYRYKSIYSQYRTPITSLEEFLLECKRYDLTPFVQIISDTVLKMTERIMGKRYVAYSGSRGTTYAMIYEYGNSSATMDYIVERCKTVGAPYAYGVYTSVLNNATDDEIKELVSRVHEVGCWLAWAGCYHSTKENQRYKSLGLDINASGWDVPDFEYGDEISIYGNTVKGFSGFTGTFNTEDNVAKLTEGNNIVVVGEQKSIIAKGSLHIQYKGDLSIKFGKVNTNITSDGLKELVFTSVIEDASPDLLLTANDDVEIYNISYKVSNVI